MRTIAGLLLLAVLGGQAGAEERASARVASAAGDSELRLELVRESLTGTHYRYRRFVDGLPMLDEHVVTREPLRAVRSAPIRQRGDLVGVRDAGRVLRVRESRETDELGRPVARFRDERSAGVLFERPLYFNAKPARVFDPNPVVSTNDPALQDRNDAAGAVPEAAYRTVELDALYGPNAVLVDVQAPSIPPVDPTGPLMFDRSESGFEDVNAYFHVDRNQRYLQSLGYAGSRRIVQYVIPIDSHATGGADTSYFFPFADDPGRGRLLFGVGGTDDAEDADLVIHEYGHAILEWISPGTFSGAYNSQARAIAEAFTDYWAFSAHYAQRRASGRDAFCFADWDARCWEDEASQNCAYPAGTDCLRRLDARRTMAELQTADTAGTEHWNGQILAGALVELFLQNVGRHGMEEGRRITDTLVVEAMFDTPAAPRFVTVARQLIDADRVLFGGTHANAICAVMSSRGITSCDAVPRGELTMHQSPLQGVAVPDGDARGIDVPLTVTDTRAIEEVLVRVDLSHPSRGDLRIELIAPDGTTVLLQRPSLDAAADVRTTFGRDAVPEESLAVLRGKSAAGVWRLHVADTRSRDAGTLESWSLLVRYAGVIPLTARPESAAAQVIPVVAHLNGARQTQFRSELWLLNRTASVANVTLLFTPSGRDGRTDFSAVQMVIAPGQLVVLDDIVRSVFATAGSGALTILGDVVASSRTYTPNSGGTAGQSIGPAAATTHATLFHGSIDDQFRTNVGVTDASGRGAAVRITVRNDAGLPPLSEFHIDVPPFGHMQIPALVPSSARGRDLVVEVESSNPVYAYASVVTNASGDPMYLADEESTVLPAIMAAGANGTTWRTGLIVVQNPIALQVRNYPLTYVDTATGEKTAISLPNGSRGMAWVSDDAVASIGRPGTRGLFHVPPGIGVGLRARIYAGAFGTAVPAMNPFEGTAHLVQVESTADYRTNVGLFSEDGGTVRVTLRDSTGGVLSVRDVELAPMRLVQFPVDRAVTGGYVELRALRGAVRAYSSLVDNRSGDASIVPSR